MPKPRLVLNGASGFVGGRLLSALANTYEVIALSRTRLNWDIGPNLSWYHHDITSGGFPSDLPQDVDTFVYLAQSKNYKNFPSAAADIFSVNVSGLLSALNWAREVGVKRFILVSSGSVYESSDKLLHEKMPFLTSSGGDFYQASKRAAELLTGPYQSYFPIVVLRPFTIYGPGQRDDSLIARMMKSIRNQDEITVANSEGPRLSLTHVDDVVNAILSACQFDTSDVFNLAGPDVLSVREIALVIADNLDTKPVFQNTKVDFVGGFAADTSKLKEFLYTPEINFHQGIKSCLA